MLIKIEGWFKVVEVALYVLSAFSVNSLNYQRNLLHHPAFLMLYEIYSIEIHVIQKYLEQ
jgi:hypothetical protein